MKTDTLFCRFQAFPSIFFELIDQPWQEADTYQFSSVEVKQLAFRIGGVFVPVKVYQEALEEGKLEGKLEAVPQLLKSGLSMEQIAEALSLTIEQVQQAA